MFVNTKSSQFTRQKNKDKKYVITILSFKFSPLQIGCFENRVSDMAKAI